MLVPATIVSYDIISRTATVSIPGWGREQAKNVLPTGVTPSLTIANSYLEKYEANTVMPSDNFQSPENVGLVQNGSDWLLLGRIVGNVSDGPVIVGRALPGLMDITMTVTTDAAGVVYIQEVAERAQVQKITVQPSAGGNFSVKFYNSNNQLQASWGDGSVTLSDSLVDAAGFGFKSDNRVAKLVMLPAGTYTVTLLGERFA